jgi:hypothetical protein
MNTINEYNNNLINNHIDIELINYFKDVHSKFYNKVDISFMSYFLEICNKENKFCIDHIKLQEYKVITTIKSSTILQSLNGFNLEENIDYQVHNVMQQSDTSRGVKYAKEYKLTPYAFKLCLIRAKNSKVYANYYLLLEIVFKNYNEYRIQYIQNINKNISKENKELHRKVDELLGYAKETKEQLDETNDKLDEVNDKYDNLNDKVDDIKEAFEDTAKRSVPDPAKEKNKSEFILLQSKILLNEITFMRGIQSYNEIKLNNKYTDNYNIIKREYNANPIQLFRMFKDTVKEELKKEKKLITDNKTLKNKMQLKKQSEKIQFNGNKLILINEYTLNNLLDKIKDVSEIKFKEYNESTEEIP